MAFYDIQKIEDEATPLGIAQYLGIKMKKSGKSIFIQCPVHETILNKADRHISNCCLGNSFKNAFYCFGCGGKGNGFDLIAAYLNLNIKKDFSKILHIAAESCGGVQFYTLTDTDYKEDRKNRENSIKHNVVLSTDDFKLSGLSSCVYPVSYEACFDESQITDIYDLQKNINVKAPDSNFLNPVSYLSLRNSSYRFNSLPDIIYSEIIKNTAKEKMEHYKNIMVSGAIDKYLPNIDEQKKNYIKDELGNYIRQQYVLLEEIYNKFATDAEKSMLNDDWLFEY